MEELRIGLVGTGAIGRSHIERTNTRLQGAKVVACADVNMDFCRSVAEKYGIQAYDSGEEMIASDAVDAVIVTTLDPFHEQYVTAAIKAGKYVFCEKAAGTGGRMPADVLWKRRWQVKNNWCRLVLCAAMTRDTAS